MRLPTFSVIKILNWYLTGVEEAVKSQTFINNGVFLLNPKIFIYIFQKKYVSYKMYSFINSPLFPPGIKNDPHGTTNYRLLCSSHTLSNCQYHKTIFLKRVEQTYHIG